MIAEIENHVTQLEELCRKHRVRRLEIFGSAADGTFDPDRSDLDFLVEYETLTPGEHYEAYFGLWEDLQALFGARVAGIVMEVTDDKALRSSERKALVVKHIAGKSREARLLKLSDLVARSSSVLPPFRFIKFWQLNAHATQDSAQSGARQ